MTIIITLSRPALAHLIESDPEFALSLKGAVLTQIGLRYFEKDVRRVIAAAEPEMFAKALKALQDDKDGIALVRSALEQALVQRPDNWGSRITLTEKMKSLITEEVERIRDRAVRDAIETVNQDISDRVHKHLADLNTDDRIERRVDRLTDAYINEQVDKRFKERLAALAAT